MGHWYQLNSWLPLERPVPSNASHVYKSNHPGMKHINYRIYTYFVDLRINRSWGIYMNVLFIRPEKEVSVNVSVSLWSSLYFWVSEEEKLFRRPYYNDISLNHLFGLSKIFLNIWIQFCIFIISKIDIKFLDYIVSKNKRLPICDPA